MNFSFLSSQYKEMTKSFKEMFLYRIFLAAIYSFTLSDITLVWTYPTTYMNRMCNGLLYVDEATGFRLDLTSNFNYASYMNCTLFIYAEASLRMMVKFRSVSIQDSVSCTKDRLILYDGPSRKSPRLTGNSGICGFVTPSKIYTSTKNVITMQFLSDSSIQYKGFSLIITPFTDVCKSGSNFRCRNNRCINSDLTCDGWNNCGDNTDEIEGCGGGLSVGGIAGIVVAGLICFVICLTIVIILRRRRSTYANIM